MLPSTTGLKRWLKDPGSGDVFSYAVILSFVLAIYHTAFRHGFIQDDYVFIYLARGFDLYGAFIAQFFSLFFYRPVTLGFFYYLSYSLFHLDPLGYHALTFALFLLTNVFVYRIAKALLGRRDVALIAALFYASRGALFTEVYWIGPGFTETATVLFILMAASAYIAYRKNKSRPAYFSCFALFLLALASKELAIVFPLVLLLLESLPGPGGSDLKGLSLRVLPFAAVTLVYLSRLLIVTPLLASGPYAMSFTASTVASNLVFYLRNSFNNGYELVLFAPLLLVAFAGAPGRRQALAYSAWFVVGLLPVIFMGTHASPHYLSLPLAGLALLFATGVGACYDKIGAHKGQLAAALIAALVVTAYISISSQEVRSGLISQEKRSDNALGALRAASGSYPDGSLIYIANPDKDIYSALGFGKAVNLYYGDGVSTYFEDKEAAPAKDFTGIYYFDYGDEELHFRGKASGPGPM